MENTSVEQSPLCSVLLAAGLSRRMARNKCLLPLGGKPLILHALEKLADVSGRVVVVLGFEAEKVRTVIENSSVFSDKIACVLNENYEAGTLSSLQTGLRNAGDAEQVMYHFADQPFLPVSFYTSFISKMNGSVQWLQPVFQGKKGHPVLLSRSTAAVLMNASPLLTIRDAVFQAGIQKTFWECTYPEILNDIDTPDDLVPRAGQ